MSLVFVILGLVCISVYYFSYTSRIDTIKTRLVNRAKTIGRLLTQSEVFSNEMIHKIDSATSFALINKVIQAYDYKNNKIYSYSSYPGDSIRITEDILNKVRVTGDLYYTAKYKDVVAHHHQNTKSGLIIIAAGEDQEGKKILARLFKILLLSFLAGLSITVVVGYVFSNKLLYPIRKIADDVNDISAQNLSRRINAGHSSDELFYLTDTLNSLLNRLQESFDLQKRFIANASHELSTPLTSISSQLEVALQRERESDEYRQVMKSVYQDVLHMIKLTQTLLEFAKASGTSGGLHTALIRIDEVLFRLLSEVAKANKIYSVLFEFNKMPAEEDELLVYGNEELLFTAIKNIVLNACKFSENHQAVVKLSIETEQLTVHVQDNGIGIPDSELSNVFQPFYRVKENKIKEGFGLGLSLALRIVKLHKGNINVSSVYGQGTTFTIHLPKAGFL